MSTILSISILCALSSVAAAGGDSLMPPQINGATATTDGQIGLSWIDPNNTSGGYAVERRNLRTGRAKVITTLGAGSVSYRDRVRPGRLPYYRIRRDGQAGETPTFSSTVQASLSSAIATVPWLVAPSLAATALSAGSIRLTWTDSNTLELGYAMERSLDGTTGFVEIGRTGANAGSFTDSTGLLASATYFYRARAFARRGRSSPYSAVVEQATLGTVTPRGARWLGLDVNPATDESYHIALTAAGDAGVDSVPVSFAWSDLEPAPGQFAQADYLEIANLYYPAQRIAVALVLAPIDTTVDRRPSDLRGKPFSDPLVIQRFERLLDYVFAHVPQLELISLSIGNEVDVYLRTTGAWDAYRIFYSAVADYARSKRPGLVVGVKSTFSGIVERHTAALSALNAASDAVFVTYYPFTPDGSSVPDPSIVLADFARLAALSTKPLYLLEVGYPSSAVLHGSEEQQAAFVRNTFAAWDVAASRIRAVFFSRATDYSQAVADQFAAYYGLSGTAATEFLRTVGFRTAGGTEKRAFGALRDEAAARGF